MKKKSRVYPFSALAWLGKRPNPDSAICRPLANCGIIRVAERVLAKHGKDPFKLPAMNLVIRNLNRVMTESNQRHPKKAFLANDLFVVKYTFLTKSESRNKEGI